MILKNTGMQFDVITAIPMFILWIAISIVALILINKGKLNKIYSFIIYAIVIVLGGVILGGIPNAVLPIQTILSTIGVIRPIITILPMIIILIILLLTVLLFGRIFCGFACPVGALQEIVSKINFKSSVKKQKNVKYKIDISLKTATIIRWILFAVVVVLTIFWSFSVLQIINPFTGFKIFTNPLVPLFLIPGITLLIVTVASIFIYRPWCRLACPFGALSSIVGRFSRIKYIRTEDCNECGLCEKICP
ncbi:MAG: 4Fe-4S binding protein, partial [Candidatus Lokiarchaeota archaeon]|nr:4Fe-4S binding protein [Candidatus Lokiarchaeota archaeon]